MMWAIDWHRAAIHAFMWLPRATATRLDTEIIRFAQTSCGPVHRVSPHDDRRLVLTVRGAVAYLYLDYDAGVIRVGRVYRRT